MKNKQKKQKKHLLWKILLVLIVLGVIGSFLPSDDNKDKSQSAGRRTQEKEDTYSTQNSDSSSDSEKKPSSQFTLTMLDVGQGLSILISVDGHYMLYDGGGKESSSFVVSYLQNHNISNLDYIIASHYDEDHISGLIGVLNTTYVNQALIPNYVSTTQTYTSFMTKLETTRTNYDFPSVGEVYSLGKAQFQIIGPDSYDHSDDNDCSISIRIEYGAVSCILTGDSTESAERAFISSGFEINSDLYVIAHHGSDTSSSDAFLDAIAPKYAFLSVSKDNTYGHPAECVLTSLKNHSIELFRTDKQGTVSAFSDGTKWWFDTDPCDDWSPRSTNEEEAVAPPVASDNTTKTPAASTYILNIHTKKFHYPDCSSVSRMNDENKETVTTTREKLIDEGYSPCGNCHP